MREGKVWRFYAFLSQNARCAGVLDTASHFFRVFCRRNHSARTTFLMEEYKLRYTVCSLLNLSRILREVYIDLHRRQWLICRIVWLDVPQCREMYQHNGKNTFLCVRNKVASAQIMDLKVFEMQYCKEKKLCFLKTCIIKRLPPLCMVTCVCHCLSELNSVNDIFNIFSTFRVILYLIQLTCLSCFLRFKVIIIQLHVDQWDIQNYAIWYLVVVLFIFWKTCK
jgi:hypothetical protein